MRRHWPPKNQIPVAVPFHQILGRSDTVVVVLLEVHAYKAGLDFHLMARGRPGLHPSMLSTVPELAKRMGIPEAANTPAHLQILYDDGSEALDLSSRDLMRRLDEVRDTPVLRDSSGSGGQDAVDYKYWLTPVPTRSFTLKFAWPDQGLAESRFRIGIEKLQPTIDQAVELWPST